ncbi:uncharacterized protein BXZ73DRAFT_99580 [Epithele typhae]|uniref:uncharacterized protein n=1 Tax=Epithele typhae TaxID=378194 RepID=UPI0020072700|nr:uncharacterized protein BXZ73DRAFT_99580 [Epithele typhae]KAH9939377.1 hypothetical protein BXZ73DRAFT_99580 [Epithele typhae]
MSSTALVDDYNPSVQYSPNWIATEQLPTEVDGTRHGAAAAGLTATLSFKGTGIQVVGVLEPTGANGQPTTQYAIDGQVVDTYTAPYTPDGQTTFNVTFFSKNDLSSEDHTLVITNMNGQSPTLFWLDYFLVENSSPPSPASHSLSHPFFIFDPIRYHYVLVSF